MISEVDLVEIEAYIVKKIWNNVNHVISHVPVGGLGGRPWEINDRLSSKDDVNAHAHKF